MIKLSKLQRDHLASVRWLLSTKKRGDWGTGRSYLMAFCFFCEAIETGEEIEIFDHHRGAYSAKNLLRQIQEIAREMQYGELAADLLINHARQSIRVLNWKEFSPITSQ